MDWNTIQIPLVGGLSQMTDPRSLQPPALAVARDIQFDDTGGIQTRAPYALLGVSSASIFGGGSLANVRRLAVNGDEILAFTSSRLYSWNAAIGSWVDKGEHLAVAIDETAQFETTSDQTQCDRAELGNTIVFCWRDEALAVGGTGAIPGGNVGPPGNVYVAAIDKTTGSVLLAPTSIAGEYRPRLVALSTKVLLFTIVATTGDLYVRAINPASPAGGVAGAGTLLLAAGAMPGTPGPIVFDARRLAATDTAAWTVSRFSKGQYYVGTVTAGLAFASAAFGRVSDGPIAIAPDSTGTTVAIVRCSGTAVLGDVITIAGISTASSGAALGTASVAPTHVTATRVPVNSPERTYAFWCAGENANSFTTSHVDGSYYDVTAVTPLGTIAMQCSLASHAFTRSGRAYVHAVFAQASNVAGGSFSTTGVVPAQVQNTCFLYRDDGLLCGKALTDRAGGFLGPLGHLPGVANTATETYAWCGTQRRIVPLGADATAGKSFSARAPVDISLVFDDQRARRSVRLGKTLYITGAEIKQYDGNSLTEVGFHIYPWRMHFDVGGLAVTPAIPDGKYTYKATCRWDNAQGERERSTTATIPTVNLTGGPTLLATPLPSLNQTHKSDTKNPVVMEVWRTTVNPGSTEDPMYLATSLDPLVTQASPNSFVPSVFGSSAAGIGTSFQDNLLDAALLLREQNEEVGAVLENLAPPPASIIAASQDRIFLAGVAGDPHSVWYSKTRDEGRIATFNDELVVAIPPAGGDITALALLSESLVVFREHAIYVVPGEGFDNTLGGQNYGPPRVVSSDCGAVSAESIALTAMGLLFKSTKGWYLLTPGSAVQYIGAPIADFDGETVVAVHTLESKHHVRVLTTARMLVWDYLVNQWAEWTRTANAKGACVWQGRHAWWSDDDTATYVEQVAPEGFAGVAYGLDVELPWVKLNDLAGRGRVRRLLLTGEWRSAHRVRVRVARNFEVDGSGSPAWFEDKILTPDSTIVGDRIELEHGPKIQRCHAMKVRLTAINVATSGVPDGEAIRLTGLAFEAGVQPGLNRNLSTAKKG